MHQFTPSATPRIGTFIDGGYFGGVININGTHKGFVWAPKAAGQIIARLLFTGKTAQGEYSPHDCAANTTALIASGSEAAKRVAELDINGYRDWLVPSRDVLELGYRHFKPTAYPNCCSWRDGENPNSVPPGWLYTEDNPAQTTLKAFKAGGSEAFDAAWYGSSTLFPGGMTAFVQYFDNGLQCDDGLSSEVRVRAVRLIQLGSSVL
ncbi:hypothetical protein [Propionivibrio sp.]|uniref:hypothetical protein n=1 Tax=Propionivibrio sp. TaxID=2212460 RepID=UPI0039E2DECB